MISQAQSTIQRKLDLPCHPQVRETLIALLDSSELVEECDRLQPGEPIDHALKRATVRVHRRLRKGETP